MVAVATGEVVEAVVVSKIESWGQFAGRRLVRIHRLVVAFQHQTSRLLGGVCHFPSSLASPESVLEVGTVIPSWSGVAVYSYCSERHVS